LHFGLYHSGGHGTIDVGEALIQKRQNSFKSFAMSTGPEKCFFTSSAQVE
jgi:hypothetical protein